MVHRSALALLLLSTFYFSHGEELAKPPVAEQGEKTRGQMLAIETNSELVSSSLVAHDGTQGQCKTDGSTCLTCRSVGMCQSGVLTEVPCRGLYPYCDARTGTCTSERRRCKEDEKAMQCPGSGYFPDPKSCRSLHVCEGDPMISYKFTCSQLQVYDHEEKKCSRPSFRVRCTSFSCFGKQGRYASYPGDRSIYTLCADATGTAMFKCPASQEFDESKQKCVPSCSSEESMADTDDDTCKKYYRCVKSNRKFDAVPSSCPGQRVFDSTTLKCVPKTPSFKCNHTPIESPNAQVSPDQANENPIGQTEETFFRQNSQINKQSADTKISTEVRKTSLGTHMDHEHSVVKETTTFKPSSESVTTTVSSIGSTLREVTTSHSNVDAVLSMLSERDSTLPSKIVVRETSFELKDHLLAANPMTDKESPTSIKGHTNILTTERDKISTSSQTTTTKDVNSIAKSEININNVKKTMSSSNAYALTTSSPLVKETYKVTTDENSISIVDDRLLKPDLNLHQEVDVKVKSEQTLDKKQAKGSEIPVQVNQEENIPSQIFHTLNKITPDKTETMENS